MTSFDLDLVPRVPLCHLPTPIGPMRRLTEYIGKAAVYIKRDDLTGVAFGGNKNRKLEFLLADAKKQAATTIITEGALQSNHCLQTAACAAKLGLECELVLSGSISTRVTGNLLLNHILDTKIHLVDRASDRRGAMKELEEELRTEGKKPYVIPTGGSTSIGALGYVNCVREVVEQSKSLGMRFDYFVHASGSGGTQAGLLIGKELFCPEMAILGISAGDPREELEAEVWRIIEDFEREWSLDLRMKRSAIKILEGYSGKGYGILNTETIETVKLIAKLEGVFLDPIYNGKAITGLIDLVNKEIVPRDNSVLFLHSGGGASLFTFDESFGRKMG